MVLDYIKCQNSVMFLNIEDQHITKDVCEQSRDQQNIINENIFCLVFKMFLLFGGFAVICLCQF